MKLQGEIIAEGLLFPEGPVAMPDGSMLVVEVARGRLTRISPLGGMEVVAELGGGPNGAAIGPDGLCYVCNNGGFTWRTDEGFTRPTGISTDYTGGSIQRVDLSSGRVETLYRSCADIRGIPLAPLRTKCASGSLKRIARRGRKRRHLLGRLATVDASEARLRCLSCRLASSPLKLDTWS